MHFKIDWASLIVGSEFTVFALFYFACECNFPSTSPWVAYIWKGDLTEGFSRYQFGGLIFGGAYTRRGLFSEFYGISSTYRCMHQQSTSAIGKKREKTSNLDYEQSLLFLNSPLTRGERK